VKTKLVHFRNKVEGLEENKGVELATGVVAWEPKRTEMGNQVGHTDGCFKGGKQGSR